MKPAPKGLTGLQKLCRTYGRMKMGNVMMAWDFVAEQAVPEAMMKSGSKRWMASERSKWER